MTVSPIITSLLATVGEISERQESMMSFIERITKQLGHLKNTLESNKQSPTPPKISCAELRSSLADILKYIESNILEANDTRELINSFATTLDDIINVADKKIAKTRLDLALSDCYLIIEGLLAAKDIGQYILQEATNGLQQQRQEQQSIDSTDEDLSIQIDVVSESNPGDAPLLDVSPKPAELTKRVKFDRENGSSLSSLPESTITDASAIGSCSLDRAMEKGITKTSIQAKLEEFLAIRTNITQKQQKVIQKQPLSSLNLSVTSMDSNTTDSLIGACPPLTASASIAEPVEGLDARLGLGPISSLKTLDSTSEIDRPPLNERHKLSIPPRVATNPKRSKSHGSTASTTNTTSNNLNKTPLKAINTPHEVTHTNNRSTSVKKIRPIILLSNVACSITSPSKSPQLQSHLTPTRKQSQRKDSAYIPQSAPITPTKFVTPKKPHPKSEHNTPTLSINRLPSPPKLSSTSIYPTSPAKPSSQSRLLTKGMGERAEQQDATIKALTSELQTIKEKMRDVQHDYARQEEEVKQILLEFSRVQSQHEEKVASLQAKLDEQREIASTWKEKTQKLEQINRDLVQQVSSLEHSKEENETSYSLANKVQGSDVRHGTHAEVDYTTLSKIQFKKLQERYLEGSLGNYYLSNNKINPNGNVTIVDLYTLLGSYDRNVLELKRQNADLEEKLNAYKCLFRAISNSD